MLQVEDLSPEDQQEYAERLAAIMPAFCAPEDQLLLNLTRYWDCPDAKGTLHELVAVGLLEKSPAGGYRQPLRPFTSATEQPESTPEPLASSPVPAKPTPTPTQPVSATPTPTPPLLPQPNSTPTLKPLRLTRPNLAA
jgi:hypothetical protein